MLKLAYLAWFCTLLLMLSCSPKDGLNGESIVGPKGAKGEQGDPGLSPTVSTVPATVVQCPNGGTQISVDSPFKDANNITHYNTTITYVCNGENGLDGQSIVGPPGPSGTPGTVITPVQFCVGFTPSYPGTFPEYGLRIGTTLYGVYSEKGGFLTLLPPGRYRSNGISAICTFMVNPDGTVSP